MIVSSGGTSYGLLHQIVAGIAALVLAILGIWMAAKQPGPIAWTVLIGVVVQGGLGAFPNSIAAAIIHALLGQILFAVSMAAMIATGASWYSEPDRAEDHGWPSLRSLGTITPILVLAQVAMGAAFRHKEMGILPHLFGAMVLVLVILCVCIFVMQQFPSHKVLRPAANHLMAIAFTQIFLGIAAFTVRTMNNISSGVLVGVTAAHATVGAMTLAAALVLTMHIRRNVYKKADDEE